LQKHGQVQKQTIQTQPVKRLRDLIGEVVGGENTANPQETIEPGKTRREEAKVATENNMPVRKMVHMPFGHNWAQGGDPFCALQECAAGQDCSDHLFHMLVSLADWFDAHGLEYYVAFGTLLGAVRDKDIIPWTEDVDLFLTPSGERQLLMHAETDLGFHAGIAGIVRVCDAPLDAASLLQTQGGSSLSSRFNASSDAEASTSPWAAYYTDINRIKQGAPKYAKFGGKARWGHFTTKDVMTLHSSEQAGFVTIRGKQFRAPGKPEELLEAKYGPDWRIPDQEHARGGGKWR